MAIFKCSYRSAMLLGDARFVVVTPDKRAKNPKVLYLLHGFGQHCGSWLNQSSVARYASERGVTLVMPDGGKSFYTDMTTGERYYSHITDELPKFLKEQMNLDPAPENTFVAGLSMGGYGALKIGMSRPSRYAVVGAFSPACDIAAAAKEMPPLARAICGDAELKGSEHDLYRLAEDLVGEERRPKIYHYCGNRDFMLDANHDFRDFMYSLPLDYEYIESDGAHEWTLWDMWAKEFVEKL